MPVYLRGRKREHTLSPPGRVAPKQRIVIRQAAERLELTLPARESDLSEC